MSQVCRTHTSAQARCAPGRAVPCARVCVRVPCGVGAGTSAGLLLGAERVALVAEAGVGARQVLALSLPAGACVRTFIQVCRKNQLCFRSTRPAGSRPEMRRRQPGWEPPLRGIQLCRVSTAWPGGVITAPWATQPSSPPPPFPRPSLPFPPPPSPPLPAPLQPPPFLPSTGLSSPNPGAGVGWGGTADQGPG